MFKAILCTILIFISFFIETNLSYSISVSEVQDSKVSPTDKMTIGEAFSNYKYLNDLTWASEKDNNGDDYVVVNGKYQLGFLLDNPVLKILFGDNIKVKDSFINFLGEQGFFINYKSIFKNSHDVIIQSLAQVSMGDKFYKDTINLNRNDFFSIFNNKPISILIPTKVQYILTFLFHQFMITHNQNVEPLKFLSLVTFLNKDSDKEMQKLNSEFRPLAIVKINGYKVNPEKMIISCDAEINVTNLFIKPTAFKINNEELKVKSSNSEIIFKTEQTFFNNLSESQLFARGGSGSIFDFAENFSTIIFLSDTNSVFNISLKGIDPIIIGKSWENSINLTLPNRLLDNLKQSLSKIDMNNLPKVITINIEDTNNSEAH